MKLFLGIVIVIFTTFIGYRLSVRYTERKNFFQDFLFFNERVKNEVQFAQSTLMDIVSGYHERNTDFFAFIYNYFFQDVKFIEKKYLSLNEKEFIMNYMSELGQGDAKSQCLFLEQKSKKLSDYLENAEEEEKRYKALYIKLGFLIGLITLVIIL